MIAAQYRDPLVLAQVRSDCAPLTRPIHLRGFLEEDFANRVNLEINQNVEWLHLRHKVVSPTKTAVVNSDEWDTLSDKELFSDSEFAKPALLKELCTIVKFQSAAKLLRYAVYSNAFSKLVSILLARPLEINTWELVRYPVNGFVAEHQDLQDTRVCSCNFYLDLPQEQISGGCLKFRSLDESNLFSVDPTPNSLSIIPIGANYFHAVSPWFSSASGRITLSVSLRPAQGHQNSA
jgi:hypothetical protein